MEVSFFFCFFSLGKVQWLILPLAKSLPSLFPHLLNFWGTPEYLLWDEESYLLLLSLLIPLWEQQLQIPKVFQPLQSIMGVIWNVPLFIMPVIQPSKTATIPTTQTPHSIKDVHLWRLLANPLSGHMRIGSTSNIWWHYDYIVSDIIVALATGVHMLNAQMGLSMCTMQPPSAITTWETGREATYLSPYVQCEKVVQYYPI